MRKHTVNNVDLVFTRRFAVIGTILLCLTTFINNYLDSSVDDMPIPRLLIALTFISFYFASFRSEKVRANCLPIIYVISSAYIFYTVYLAYQNNFQVYDTSATTIIAFAIGALFKDKSRLKMYLGFVLTTFLCFFFLCETPEMSTTYFIVTLFLMMILAFIIYGSRIDAVDSLTRSRQELQRSEERFRNVFECSPIGIMLFDDTFQIVKSNQVLQSMLDYEESEFVNLKAMPFVYNKDRVTKQDFQKEIVSAQNNTVVLEQRWVKKGGEIIWVRGTISQMEPDKEGNAFFLAMIEDISFKKQAEFRLKEYAEKLEVQNKALEEFSYVISHDLQEPLRMISSYTQIIQSRYIKQINNEEANIDFSYVIDGVSRMRNLIKDMLAYSRWSAKPFTLEKIDPNDLMVDVIQNLTMSIKDRDATVYCTNLPEVPTSKVLFSQVMQNLIGNGLKYSQKDRKPVIRIEAEKRDFDVVFSVQDNGQGFEEKDKDRIFGIFQRLHGRQSEYKGTGIGLAICKRIIEKQGGKIWAEGVKGEGATFYFTLPNGMKN